MTRVARLLLVLLLLAPSFAHAAAYQLLANGGVLREADGANIPSDPNNRDWIAYQAWLAAGNTADPLAGPSAADRYASALAGGLAITSSATPSLNGTYAIDDIHRSDIIALETSINAGKGFPPGGATTIAYPDINGAAHVFTEADWTNFAAAVRDYYYALTTAEATALAGQSATWPSATAAIP